MTNRENDFRKQIWQVAEETAVTETEFIRGIAMVLGETCANSIDQELGLNEAIEEAKMAYHNVRRLHKA